MINSNTIISAHDEGQVQDLHRLSTPIDEGAVGETPGKLKRILVATDFSPPAANAVKRAAMLAAEHSAELEIVHVASSSDWSDSRCGERWQELKALVRAYGVTAGVKNMTGSRAATLAREAAQFGADLVILGSRKERSLRDGVIGTTAERLVRRWSGNTLIVRKSPASLYATIVACVSLAPESCSVVKSALALSPAASLSLLHVYQPSFEKMLFSRRAGLEAIRRNRMIAKRELTSETKQLLERCGLPDSHQLTIVLMRGHHSAIPDAAAHCGPDVIAVGRSTSAPSDLVFGSVTKDVLRSASCDVLVSR